MTEQEEIDAIKEYFSYNAETGIVTWKKSPPKKTIPYGTVAGTTDSYGYRITKLFGKMYKIHRIAWVLYYGKFPIKFIDHINGIVDDNRIINLRDVSARENAHNKSINRAGKLIGASKSKSKKFPYTSVISVSGEKYELGRYATEELAHSVYIEVYEALKNRGFDSNEYITREDFLETYGDIIQEINYHPHQPINSMEQPYLSIYKGVILIRKCSKWCATVWVNKQKYISKYLPTEKDAGRAYDIMSLYLREETPHLNFPREDYDNIDLSKEFNNIMNKRRGLYRGVSLHTERQMYDAQINVNKQHYWLGYYETALEAAIARDKKAYELLGEKAKLNFPERIEEYKGVTV